MGFPPVTVRRAQQRAEGAEGADNLSKAADLQAECMKRLTSMPKRCKITFCAGVTHACKIVCSFSRAVLECFSRRNSTLIGCSTEHCLAGVELLCMRKRLHELFQHHRNLQVMARSIVFHTTGVAIHRCNTALSSPHRCAEGRAHNDLTATVLESQARIELICFKILER